MCISWTNKRFDNIKMHGATVKIEIRRFTPGKYGYYASFL